MHFPGNQSLRDTRAFPEIAVQPNAAWDFPSSGQGCHRRPFQFGHPRDARVPRGQREFSGTPRTEVPRMCHLWDRNPQGRGTPRTRKPLEQDPGTRPRCHQPRGALFHQDRTTLDVLPRKESMSWPQHKRPLSSAAGKRKGKSWGTEPEIHIPFPHSWDPPTFTYSGVPWGG